MKIINTVSFRWYGSSFHGGFWHPGGTSASSQASTLRASALQECFGIFHWPLADDEVSGMGTLLADEPASGGETEG